MNVRVGSVASCQPCICGERLRFAFNFLFPPSNLHLSTSLDNIIQPYSSACATSIILSISHLSID